MEDKPKGTLCGFIFAIDQFGNILLSENREKSKHINLCAPPVIGAGEVLLRNTNTGVELVLINNKSGMYLPKNEFFKPLKELLKTINFNVANTKFEDEHKKLLSDWTKRDSWFDSKCYEIPEANNFSRQCLF